MIIKIATNKNVIANIAGYTVFDTDDYIELKGKTVDEIEQMDVTKLLNVKTENGNRLTETLEFSVADDIGNEWGFATNVYRDGYGFGGYGNEVPNVYIYQVDIEDLAD